MYIDKLLFLNFAINAGLLFAAARLTRRKIVPWRLLLGVIFGIVPVLHVAAGWEVYPPLWWFFIAMIPFLMVSIAFYPINIRDIFYTGGTVFIAAFASGGLVIVLQSAFQQIWPGGGDNFWVCFMLTALIIATGMWLWRPYITDKKWEDLLRVKVVVSYGNRKRELEAYLDTGNRIRDPFLKKPVMVASYQSIREVFPEALFSIMEESNFDSVRIVEAAGNTSMAGRFYLIPFSGINGKSDLLLGFKPDGIKIFQGNKILDAGTLMTVGIFRDDSICPGNVQALMPYEILDLVG